MEGNAPKKERKKRIFKRGLYSILGAIVLFLGISLFPIRGFLFHGFLSGKTLVIITNENEARPCGGFATAYGIVRVFPPKIELNDIYTLKSTNLGKAEFPLTKVTQEMNFWDLGTSSNSEECAKTFQEKYTLLTQEKIKNIVLVDFETLEKIITLFSPIKFQNTTLSGENFFADISRSVANVDRHDEKSLKERKSPMKEIAKQMMKKTIINPFYIPHITQIIQEQTQKGNLYTPKVSPQKQIQENDFAFIEWNLGGGKSSRYLKKQVQINAREEEPEKWKLSLKFKAKNIGQKDAPLSQDWIGIFEVHFPSFLEEEKTLLETKIPTNGVFEKEWFFDYTGALPNFRIFTARNQEIFTDITLSLYPQKKLTKSNFSIQENTGIFFEKIKETTDFIWEEVEDKTAPFITLHEIIPKERIESIIPKEKKRQEFESSNMIVEVHVNENIQIKDNFSATLKDKNWINKHTDNPIFQSSYLLPNKKTLILGFSQKQKQVLERFELQLKNAEDKFGNPLQEDGRTVIDRQK